MPRSYRPAISCVVPAHDEAENLAPLLQGLTAQLAGLSEHWEVIVVDDGSRDATPAAIAPWLLRPGVRYLRLSGNFAKEAALTAGIFTGVTAFTNAPLRLRSALGVVVALLVLASGVWIVVECSVFGIDVPGRATLVCGMLFLSGVQLLSIGILGVYVVRSFDEVEQRPVCVVGSETGRGGIGSAAAPRP